MAAAAAAAAAALPGGDAAGPQRLDPDTWQTQLEELLALQAVLDQDFSLLEAPGARTRDGPTATGGSAGGGAGGGGGGGGGGGNGRWLDPEELLMAGPPPELYDTDGGGVEDGSGGGGRGCGCFVAEALVHVDVPEGGLQLVLEVQPQPPSPQCCQGPVAAAKTHGHTEGGQQQQQPERQRQRQRQEADAPGSSAPRGGDGASTSGRGEGGGGGGSGGGSGGARGSGSGRGAGERGGRGGRTGGGRSQGRGGRDGRGPSGGRVGGRYGGSGGGDGGGAVEVAGDRGLDGTTFVDSGDLGSAMEASGGISPVGDGPEWVTVGGGGQGRGRGRGGRGRGGGRGGGGGEVHQRSGPTAGGGSGSGAGPSSRAAPAGGRTPDRPGSAAGSSAAGPGPQGGSSGQRSRSQTEANAAGMLSSNSDTRPVPQAAALGARTEGTAEVREQAATPAAGSPPPAPTPPPPPPPPAAPVLVPFGPRVQFLSPIRVTLTLPPDYPAASAPAVSLAALWLAPRQAQALAGGLSGVWEAQGPGGPIAAVWLDWLRGEALGCLGLKEQLVLRPTQQDAEQPSAQGQQQEGREAEADGGGGAGGAGGAGGGGAGAAEGEDGPEGLAVALLRYSARREQDKFNESNVRCPICLEEHLGARCVRLPECHHACCAPCLAAHLRSQLGQGAVDRMRCPLPDCRRQLPPYALQQLMAPEEYERWERLTLQRTLDKMEDLVYCPRCREPCLEEPDHSALCPGCFFSFCALCEEPWHPGSTCLGAEGRLALLEARRNRQEEGEEGEGGRSATERARKQLNRLNELKSLALLSTTTKQCPVCSMGVEKTEGCNKMTCGYCGSYFCWKCNQIISGYDHFQQPAGQPGGCVLFDQEEIDRWNARWGGGGFAAPRAAEVEQRGAFVNLLRRNGAVGEVRVCRCVVCGQPNVKEGGNNDIRCWSCNGHFCYLCRAWLRNRPGQHFGIGPGRCRQHSDD